MLKAAVLCVLLFAASPASACGGDSYDAERELAAINSALVTAALNKPEKDAIRALRDKASISPASLSIRGKMLQARYREQAMRRLGLQRLPAMPEAALRAVDRALGKMKSDDVRLAAMKALQTKAETQWKANDFEGARASLEEIRKELNLDIVTFRC
jgi:hypothetical protein